MTPRLVSFVAVIVGYNINGICHASFVGSSFRSNCGQRLPPNSLLPPPPTTQHSLVPKTPLLPKQQPRLLTTTSLSMMELGEAWAAYNVALQENPLLVKSVTGGVLVGAADWMGQFVEAELNKYNTEDTGTALAATSASSTDWSRVARYALFGLAIQGPWSHFYYQVLDGALPPTPEPWTATTAIKVVIDQFIQAPFFTLVVFGFFGTLEGKTREAIQKQLQANYADMMVANWKVWVPATAINFAFVPPILRVLYLNSIFFFWCIFVSIQLNKDQSSVEATSISMDTSISQNKNL